MVWQGAQRINHKRRAQERAQLEELVTEQLPADNAVRMAPATEVLAQVAVDGASTRP